MQGAAGGAVTALCMNVTSKALASGTDKRYGAHTSQAGEGPCGRHPQKVHRLGHSP